MANEPRKDRSNRSPGLIRVRFANNMADLGRTLDLLEEQLLRVAPELCFNARLILEELGSNLVKYGYDDQQTHYIDAWVSLASCSGVPAQLGIEDDGHPFDPLVDAAAPDISQAVEHRSIGGLGIHLIKNLTATQVYTRTADGKNRFVVTFLPSEPSQRKS